MWLAVWLACAGRGELPAEGTPDPDPTAETPTPPTTGAPADCATGWLADRDESDAAFDLSGIWSEAVGADFDEDGSAELLGVESGAAWRVAGPYHGDRWLDGDDTLVGDATGVGAADIDGDGHLDAILSGSTLVVRPGGGDGTFGAPVDLPLDGRYSWHVTAGDGAFAWSSRQITDGPIPLDSIVLLVDAVDAADGSLFDAARLRVDVETGYYGNQPGLPGDLTGDGVSDLVVADGGSGAYVYDGTLRGSLLAGDASWRIEGGAGWSGLDAPIPQHVDVDGDGTADLLLGGFLADVEGDPGAQWIFLGGEPARAGSFPELAYATLLSDDLPVPAVAPIGDFDADGLADLAFLLPHEGAYDQADLEIVSSSISAGEHDIRALAQGAVSIDGTTGNPARLTARLFPLHLGDCDDPLGVATAEGILLFTGAP